MSGDLFWVGVLRWGLPLKLFLYNELCIAMPIKMEWFGGTPFDLMFGKPLCLDVLG